MLISGNLPYKTEVASVLVYGQIESGNTNGAAAVSVLLLAVVVPGAADHLVRGAQGDRAMSRIALRSVALFYLRALLIVPVGMVFYRAFENGFAAAVGRGDHAAGPARVLPHHHVTLIAVPLNAVFGVVTAWLLARYEFPGKRFLDVLIDLPFAVSPVIVGLALILVWGRDGWFGSPR